MRGKKLLILLLRSIECYFSGQIEEIRTKYNRRSGLGKKKLEIYIYVHEHPVHGVVVFRYAITIWYFDADERRRAQSINSQLQVK